MSSGYVTCAVWLLRIALVVQCVGQSSLYVFDTFRENSPASVLFEKWGATTDAARQFDEYGHIAALAAAVALLGFSLPLSLISRSSNSDWERWPRSAWQLPLVVGLAAWNILLFAGTPFTPTEVSFAVGMVPRVAVPFALCLLVFRKESAPPRGVMVRIATVVLRLSMVAAFAFFGWLAVHFDPEMVDALLGTFHNVLRLPLSDDVAHYLVCAVGIVGAALAIFMLFFRWRGTAVAMAAIAGAWLLLTLGEGGLYWVRYAYPGVAAQFALFAAPVAIVWLQATPSAASDADEDDATDDELVIVETTQE